MDERASQIGEFTFDPRRRGLFLGSDRVHLTAKPFEVLGHLVRRRGQVVSKTELLETVWRGQQDENVVEQAIRQIRRALKEDKASPRFIQTIPSQGYCFIGAPEGDSRNPITPEPPIPDLKGLRKLYHSGSVKCFV